MHLVNLRLDDSLSFGLPLACLHVSKPYFTFAHSDVIYCASPHHKLFFKANRLTVTPWMHLSTGLHKALTFSKITYIKLWKKLIFWPIYDLDGYESARYVPRNRTLNLPCK